jgi:2'-5' RNA ligase
MPFAVQLFVDAATDAALRLIWRDLAEGNIAPYLHTSANRPHLTVALYERLALAESDAALVAVAAEVSPFAIAFAHLGVFPPSPEAVVFCAPPSTPRLRAVQARVHSLLDRLAHGADERYLPENWIPHCSLATHCPSERLVDALAVSLRLPLPLLGHIVEIGITQTSPARPYSSHPLQPDDS